MCSSCSLYAVRGFPSQTVFYVGRRNFNSRIPKGSQHKHKENLVFFSSRPPFYLSLSLCPLTLQVSNLLWRKRAPQTSRGTSEPRKTWSLLGWMEGKAFFLMSSMCPFSMQPNGESQKMDWPFVNSEALYRQMPGKQLSSCSPVWPQRLFIKCLQLCLTHLFHQAVTDSLSWI